MLTVPVFAVQLYVFAIIEEVETLIAHAAGLCGAFPLFAGQLPLELLVGVVDPGTRTAADLARLHAIVQQAKLLEARLTHPGGRRIEFFTRKQMFELLVFIPDKAILTGFDAAGQLLVMQCFQCLEAFLAEPFGRLVQSALQLHPAAPHPGVFAAPHTAFLLHIAAFPDFLPAGLAEALGRIIIVAVCQSLELLKAVPHPAARAAGLRAGLLPVLKLQKTLVAALTHLVGPAGLSPRGIIHGLLAADLHQVVTAANTALKLRGRKQVAQTAEIVKMIAQGKFSLSDKNR